MVKNIPGNLKNKYKHDEEGLNCIHYKIKFISKSIFTTAKSPTGCLKGGSGTFS